ncbi:MAG TPA: YIP1 family protein [Bryobacterales bacterium]|nr:YIP1 family protein [Bryobacterales bacterium]
MAAPAPGSPAATIEPGRLNPILDVFFSPAAAMDTLARRPRFLVALLVITVVSIGVMGIAFERGVTEHGIRQKFESSPRFERIPAEQREAVIDRAVHIGSYTAVVGAAVGPALGLLLTSGVLLLFLMPLGGLRVTLRQVMAVVTHAWLPLSLSGLVGIPILLAKDPDQVDFQNIVPMANLSFLFSPTDQHKLYMAAASIDLFSLWTIALLAIGLSRLTGKSKGAVLPVILAPWILYIVIFKVLLG